jgi:hypothetical protein
MAIVKKAQKGALTPMKDYVKKYPGSASDTLSKNDPRGSEINSGAPKKVLSKYNDLYNAFDKKFKGAASYKKGGKVAKSGCANCGKKVSMKKGGKISKKK